MSCFERFFRRKPRPFALSHGVYVHCGWERERKEFGTVPGIQCPHPYPWEAIRTEDRVPLLGEYDEADPAITEQRLKWMEEGRIDYAVYQVDWDEIRHALLVEHCAVNHSPHSPVKFCLSFWNVAMAEKGAEQIYAHRTREEVIEGWRQYARRVAEFASQPNYLRIGGRPVLFQGEPRTLALYTQWNIHPTDITDILRAEIPGVYLVAVNLPQSLFPVMGAWGFDAFTEYLLHSEHWEGVQGVYRDRWKEGVRVARETGVDYWVPATSGYDSTAWGSPEPHKVLPTPAEFTAHLREARAFARDNADVTKGQVVTYAWNEFGEGGIIEPMKEGMIRSGHEMLNAHRDATK